MTIYINIEIRIEFNKRGDDGQRMGVVRTGLRSELSFKEMNATREIKVLWETGAIHPLVHDHYLTVPHIPRHREVTSLDSDLLYKVQCPQSLSLVVFILQVLKTQDCSSES